MRTKILVTVVALALAGGCKKKEEAKPSDAKKPPPAPASATAPAPAPASAIDRIDAAPPAQPEAGMPGLKGEGKMQNCPSAVAGAATKVENTKGGVVVTVTAADPKDQATVDDIRARARKLAEASRKDAGEPKHTGAGEGGGSGPCPVVLQDTKIESKDVDGGAALTVTPADKGKVEWLQQEAAARAEKMKKK